MTGVTSCTVARPHLAAATAAVETPLRRLVLGCVFFASVVLAETTSTLDDLTECLRLVERSVEIEPDRSPGAGGDLLQAAAARGLLARAECGVGQRTAAEVDADIASAEALLREFGPSLFLARALLVAPSPGTDRKLTAERDRKRFEGAAGIAVLAGGPTTEGRALCGLAGLDAFAGRAEAARARLDQIVSIVQSTNAPRVTGCGAYWEGL